MTPIGNAAQTVHAFSVSVKGVLVRDGRVLLPGTSGRSGSCPAANSNSARILQFASPGRLPRRPVSRSPPARSWTPGSTTSAKAATWSSSRTAATRTATSPPSSATSTRSSVSSPWLMLKPSACLPVTGARSGHGSPAWPPQTTAERKPQVPGRRSGPAQTFALLLQQLAGHHDPLDLVGLLVDLCDTGAVSLAACSPLCTRWSTPGLSDGARPRPSASSASVPPWRLQVAPARHQAVAACATCPDAGGRSGAVTSPMRAVRSVRRCTR